MKKYSFIPYESFSFNSPLGLKEIEYKCKEKAMSEVNDYFNFKLKNKKFTLEKFFLSEYDNSSPCFVP